MSDPISDTTAATVLARIMDAHGETIARTDPALAETAWGALSEEPTAVTRPADNWLEQTCQKLYRFLNDCWIGTGQLMQDGSASYDFHVWRERAAEMMQVARAYGRSEEIRAAVARLPGRSGIEDRLRAMEQPGYEFETSDVATLRRLLAEDRIVCRIIADEEKNAS